MINLYKSNLTKEKVVWRLDYFQSSKHNIRKINKAQSLKSYKAMSTLSTTKEKKQQSK